MQLSLINPLRLHLAVVALFLTINSQAQSALPQSQRLQWWRDARFGLFIHWGPVSLTGREISWSRNDYGKSEYDSLYRRFNPIHFNAREWVAQAKAGGMKYVVLTAKHHDGFCLWNTQTIPYNIMSTPFGRDVCKELADAVHEAGLSLGWYFSPADWKDPDCRNPVSNDAFNARLMAQLTELLSNYGKVSLLWFDYEGSPSPANPKPIYELAHRLQPGIILNNRLEAFTPDESHSQPGKYGDYTTPEGFVAGFGQTPWETCTNMGHQWSWKFGDTPRSLRESVHTLLRCVGGNGNLLLNVGPDSLGQFPPLFANRLHELGAWIAPRSTAIYGTLGGPYTPTGSYVCTRKGSTIYVHILSGTDEMITLPPLPAILKKATLMDGRSIVFNQGKEKLQLTVPAAMRDSIATIIALTVDRPTATIPLIRPFTKTGSLAYTKPAKASSELSHFLHDASAALDDDPNTYWKLGRRTDVNFEAAYGKDLSFQSPTIQAMYNPTGWLEVDLGKPQRIGEIVVSDFSSKPNSKPIAQIGRFSIQYQQGNEWVTLATGQQPGSNWRQTVSPVMAQRLRLVIQESTGSIGIREFQVFPPKGSN
ncbi:alpha-L-fucosidase [Spirosoma sp. KCTC 42546]|uniref:alpha-L-fucosidase n=1 Tax=Spirosoma sp. KCTC 42546 TaxID=2520506 RepID=UPI0011599DC5|nr:alpha-L-fucosidase [Spirosoma sp. KCTC 42546]QDK79950.1 alpha-L-fucosidase [Spirosoma sp. KCTC 42546]